MLKGCHSVSQTACCDELPVQESNNNNGIGILNLNNLGLNLNLGLRSSFVVDRWASQHLCICAGVCVFALAFVCLHSHLCACIRICVLALAFTYLHWHLCVFIGICVFALAFVCLHWHLCVCIGICVLALHWHLLALHRAGGLVTIQVWLTNSAHEIVRCSEAEPIHGKVVGVLLRELDM